MTANFRIIHLLLFFFWQIVAILAYQDASVLELRIVEFTVSQPNKRTRPATRERPRLRDVTTEMSTCGYQDGDPSKPRTAEPDYDCRIDTAAQLWGFCPTAIRNLSDCGLAGACVDGEGTFGFVGVKSIGTIYCTEMDLDRSFCSVALIDSGEDQTFYYIACGPDAAQITYFPTPTAELQESPSTTSEISSSSESARDGLESTQDGLGATPSLSSHPITSTSNPDPNSTTDPKSTTTSQQLSTEPTTNIGAIIGGVLGGLALVCGTVVAVVYILRRNQQIQNGGQAGYDQGGLAQDDRNTTAQLQPDKHAMRYSAVPPSEADDTALTRAQIQSFEMYSAPSSWQQHREMTESG
ncbi:hypothetical protein F4813DRAFT_368877 [Daldinia decipiens]|uniref:uncharacterized protein n=1 Tax=Daldinia decipiens TaxID=326647 RepID=UPI0020C5A2AF|nr:uncharacterized protein F4813DRAFT_368877 [Daldinia decipiens]KAI1654918.1 hypothetical protein F4813DRAFT_368877 [Daldinia decipiens]